MFAKLTVLLFVTAIYARQISTAEQVSDSIDVLLKRLEEAIDKAVTEAKGFIEEAEKTANQTAANVEDVTRKALSGIEKKFQDELDALKAQAKNASVDVDECFGQDETTLIHLPDATAAEMVKCAEGYVLQVFDDANGALDKIKKIGDDLTEVKKDVEKCNNDVQCLEELAKKIALDIVVLPTEITKDVTDVIEIVRKIEPEIQKCGTDAIENFETAGQKLVNKISKCVLDKIKH